MTAALAKLKEKDRVLAEHQRLCPVMKDSRLGSMGTPVRIEIKGVPVFLCCEGCRDDVLADAETTLKKVEELKKPAGEKKLGILRVKAGALDAIGLQFLSKFNVELGRFEFCNFLRIGGLLIWNLPQRSEAFSLGETRGSRRKMPHSDECLDCRRNGLNETLDSSETRIKIFCETRWRKSRRVGEYSHFVD